MGNKTHKSTKRVIDYETAREFADGLGIPYLETNKHSLDNVEEALIVMTKEILKRLNTVNNATTETSTPSIVSTKKKGEKELEIEKEKIRREFRAAEIEKLLRALGMNFSHIPDSIRSNDFQTFTFLNQLLKGKQNIRKQTIMIVGEGTLKEIIN